MINTLSSTVDYIAAGLSAVKLVFSGSDKKNEEEGTLALQERVRDERRHMHQMEYERDRDERQHRHQMEDLRFQVQVRSEAATLQVKREKQQQDHQLQLLQEEHQTRRAEIDAPQEKERIKASREKQRQDAKLKLEKLKVRKKAQERRDRMNKKALAKLGNDPKKIEKFMRKLQAEEKTDYKSDEDSD